jgi:hypothetical protein
MAARRLLIVMLILLGLSTLAAALVPQRTLRDGTTATTTQPAQTAPKPLPAGGRSIQAKVVVGGTKIPVVAGPICAATGKPRCAPIHVGDQLTLLVRSEVSTQLSIPEFGLVGFATPETPARFELLATSPGTFGILFVPPQNVGGCLEKVAGRIEILRPGGKAQEAGPVRCAARGGPGRP